MSQKTLHYPSKNINFKITNFLLVLINIFGVLTLGHNSLLAKPDENDNSISIDYLNKKESTDYILGEGDVIAIDITQEKPKVSQKVTIDINGTVNLPNLNRIYISGLSVSELTNLLNKRYKEFVFRPNVEIEILQYRPITVYLDGEVANPGAYTFQGSKSFTNLDAPFNLDLTQESNNSKVFYPTVFEAIKTAGGITTFSDLSVIEVIRKNTISNGGGYIKTTLNFINLINQGDTSQNIRIFDQDVIKIKRSPEEAIKQLSKAIKSNLNPQFINVIISGRVNKPGVIKVSKISTLNDAIYINGSKKALHGKIRFIRYNNFDGSIENRLFKFSKNSRRGSYKNPVLKNGDIIHVGNSALSTANEIISEITNPFIGLFTVKSLLEDL